MSVITDFDFLNHFSQKPMDESTSDLYQKILHFILYRLMWPEFSEKILIFLENVLFQKLPTYEYRGPLNIYNF